MGVAAEGPPPNAAERRLYDSSRAAAEPSLCQRAGHPELDLTNHHLAINWRKQSFQVNFLNSSRPRRSWRGCPGAVVQVAPGQGRLCILRPWRAQWRSF